MEKTDWHGPCYWTAQAFHKLSTMHFTPVNKGDSQIRKRKSCLISPLKSS